MAFQNVLKVVLSIYLFLAVLGLCCCAGHWAQLTVSARASRRGVFSCGAWAVELAGLGRCDMWAQLRLPGCGADSIAVGQGFVACGIFPDQGSISYIDTWILYHWTTRKVKVAQTCLTLCNSMDRTVLGILQARILEWVSLFLLQGIFPTQGLNPGLLPCRWILYQLPEKPLKYKKIY